MKKAIAMKCTQEQWDSIKDRIPKEIINDNQFNLINYPYLTNNYNSQNRIGIGTHSYDFIKSNVKIHETFNAKIFLDACGIDCEPEYSITKLQLTQLLKNNEEGNEQLVSADLRAWFPDAFKKELEVGKWYKSSCSVFFVTKIENEKVYAYGVNDGEWLQDGCFDIKFSKNDTEATPQEVESALICEAKKRGFKKGIRYLSAWNNEAYCIYPQDLYYNAEKNCLATHNGNECIFQNGQWATIIQPEKMTLEQIEKELGRKIEIV